MARLPLHRLTTLIYLESEGSDESWAEIYAGRHRVVWRTGGRGGVPSTAKVLICLDLLEELIHGDEGVEGADAAPGSSKSTGGTLTRILTRLEWRRAYVPYRLASIPAASGKRRDGARGSIDQREPPSLLVLSASQENYPLEPLQPTPSSLTPFRATVQVRNRLGLHLRPASQLVRLASSFEDCDICITKEGQKVNAKSIMGVIMLAAEQGSELMIEAAGPSAERALAQVLDLLNSGFGED